MAYATPIQTAVNSGELSPRMAARVDFDRYRNGCARARNLVLLPTGGFTKAPGSRFVNATKDETKAGRLLPFKFSQGDAAIIEMAENAARFYRRQARIDAPNIGASITNGTFTSNITGWTDRSTNASASESNLGSATSTTDTATYTGIGSALTLPGSHRLLVVGIASLKGSAPADAPSTVTVTILNGAGTGDRHRCRSHPESDAAALGRPPGAGRCWPTGCRNCPKEPSWPVKGTSPAHKGVEHRSRA